MQSMADCTTFMDKSFKSLHKFLDAFNVSSFIPVVMGTVITHHSLLTSLQVNVSQIPLKIFLSPLTSDAMAASRQMALLSYVAQQGIAVWERQAQSKLTPGTGTRGMDPTLEFDYGSGASLVPQKLILSKAGLTPSKKVRGPVIQDSTVTHIATGPTQAPMRRHSTSTTPTISGKEAQHS